MQKLIVTAYIFIAVAVSAFAQTSLAAQHSIDFNSRVDAQQQTIEVEGLLPSVCYSRPEVHIAPLRNDTLLFQVVALNLNSQCPRVIGGTFQIVAPLSLIKQSLKAMNWNTEARYRVIADNRQFDMWVDFSKVKCPECEGMTPRPQIQPQAEVLSLGDDIRF